MKNLYILVEGQTEEAFVSRILAPYLLNVDIYAKAIICTTSKSAGRKNKGGVSYFKKIEVELNNLCKSHPREYITTMFDYYGMPTDTPNIDCNIPDIYKRVEYIESSLDEKMGYKNLKFNFMLHEFESLLFSDPKGFYEVAEDNVVKEISKIRTSFLTPEHINNSTETAPSKRILSIMPNYSKVRMGTMISCKIGMDKMIAECKHFADWVNFLKSWVK